MNQLNRNLESVISVGKVLIRLLSFCALFNSSRNSKASVLFGGASTMSSVRTTATWIKVPMASRRTNDLKQTRHAMSGVSVHQDLSLYLRLSSARTLGDFALRSPKRYESLFTVLCSAIVLEGISLCTVFHKAMPWPLLSINKLVHPMSCISCRILQNCTYLLPQPSELSVIQG